MAGNLLGTLWSFRGEAQLHHALADVLRSLRVPQYVGNITEIEKTFILRTYLIGLYTNIHIHTGSQCSDLKKLKKKKIEKKKVKKRTNTTH